VVQDTVLTDLATLAILPGVDTDRLTVADHTGREVAFRTLKPSTYHEAGPADWDYAMRLCGVTRTSRWMPDDQLGFTCTVERVGGGE
jgi:hypothetical protein